jgi:hypothetical protein
VISEGGAVRWIENTRNHRALDGQVAQTGIPDGKPTYGYLSGYSAHGVSWSGTHSNRVAGDGVTPAMQADLRTYFRGRRLAGLRTLTPTRCFRAGVSLRTVMKATRHIML